MNIYETNDIADLLRKNSYPGRGIVVGKTSDGRCACSAYFIMGRSANSRNRVFKEEGGCVFTRPFDESKVEDPSLIIYAAIRSYKNNLIITNGDQTDTIYEGLKAKKSFSEALSSRCFEPDIPNFTPRISAMLTFERGDFSYRMSILKSIDEEGSGCARFEFGYPSVSGLGHFIHTYICGADPLPSFCGEPKRVRIGGDIDAFADSLWNALDSENKISLYVRYTNLSTGNTDARLINKNN